MAKVIDAQVNNAAEAVRREARVSWWGLLPQVLLGIAAALVGVALMLAMPYGMLGGGIAIAGCCAFVWYLGNAWTTRISALVRLTDRCVVLKTGIVSFHTSTVMLNRIESMDIDQTVWQRMTGCGTLTIRGMGNDDLRLEGIEDPVGFQAEARRRINAATSAVRV